MGEGAPAGKCGICLRSQFKSKVKDAKSVFDVLSEKSATATAGKCQGAFARGLL